MNSHQLKSALPGFWLASITGKTYKRKVNSADLAPTAAGNLKDNRHLPSLLLILDLPHSWLAPLLILMAYVTEWCRLSFMILPSHSCCAWWFTVIHEHKRTNRCPNGVFGQMISSLLPLCTSSLASPWKSESTKPVRLVAPLLAQWTRGTKCLKWPGVNFGLKFCGTLCPLAEVFPLWEQNI